MRRCWRIYLTIKMPIFYECQRCTACCRWPGQVRLTDEEITRIAEFKQVSEHAFIQQYTRLNKDKTGLALMDKKNGECIFLENESCAIQSVKPRQCREFPNLWNFPGFEKLCHAIPREMNEEDYKVRMAAVIKRGAYLE
ncbi:MAG: YkgJ family cysteine cluster protein [Verrucomicrobiales bacterium]